MNRPNNHALYAPGLEAIAPPGADALIAIVGEAHSDPDALHAAPHNAPVHRLDEVKAAKDLVLCYAPGCMA